MAFSAKCNGRQDCRDSSDEDLDLCSNVGASDVFENFVTYNVRDDSIPPAVVDMDGQGDRSIRPLASLAQCPETHFLCPGTCLCLVSVAVTTSVCLTFRS